MNHLEILNRVISECANERLAKELRELICYSGSPELTEVYTRYIEELEKPPQSTIKEALAQPEQEPVGYFNANSDGKWEQSDSNDGVPFYVALPSQPRESEQEPAVFLKEWSDWRDMVVVNIMRHGSIDKHLARELANHFQSMTPQPKEREQEPVAEYIGNNPDEPELSKRIGLIERFNFIPLRTKLYTTPPQLKACVYCGQLVLKEKNT